MYYDCAKEEKEFAISHIEQQIETSSFLCVQEKCYNDNKIILLNVETRIKQDKLRHSENNNINNSVCENEAIISG